MESDYIDRLLSNIKFDRDLKVVWDAGNGATGNILRNLIKKIPGSHELLNAEIDGTFPSHPPDPSEPDNLKQLQETVLKKKYDLGVAFDGDGDRVAAIDEKGNILCGDQLLLYFGIDLLKRKPNSVIISDVKASQSIFDEINRLNGQALMWKTGHSHIKAKMAVTGAILAGEMSGHFFFKEDYYGYDDGIYAAIKLLQIFSNSTEKLSDFYANLPVVSSTPEIRIPCHSDNKFQIPLNIKSRLAANGCTFSDIDGIRVQLKEGWWLLRASNTQDVLVARCEAATNDDLKFVIEDLRNQLAIEKMNLPLKGLAHTE